VPTLDGTATDGVEYLERRDEFAPGIHLDTQAARGGSLDAIRQVIYSDTEAGVFRRPGGHCGPLESLGERVARRRAARAAAFTGEQAGGGSEPADKVTSFHASVQVVARR
jgi:hypothetical protein